MNKKALLFILIFFTGWSSYAQQHRVEAGIGRYKFYAHVSQLYDNIGMFHIKYSCQVVPKIRLGLAFSQTPVNSLMLTGERHPFDSASLNKLVYRGKYQYYDVECAYTFFQKPRHNIHGFTGISLAHGKNSYLDWLVLAPGPPHGQGDVIDVRFVEKAESYFGLFAGIGYDYFFWKKRISTGSDVSVRWYSNGFPFQLNYGLHVGYNF